MKNVESRLGKLERTNPKPRYQLFFTEPGAPGHDPDGWLPGEREAAEEAEGRGNPVTIINISERKEATCGN